VKNVVIVEIDRFFDQPETEQPRVEIEILLGVVDGRGDVMEALNQGFHRTSPGLRRRQGSSN
jgi:hypothetical protein